MSIGEDRQLWMVLLQLQISNELEGTCWEDSKDLIKHEGCRAMLCQRGEWYFLIWQILLIEPRAAGKIFQN